MIQRIQSLFLLGVVLLCLLLAYIPVYELSLTSANPTDISIGSGTTRVTIFSSPLLAILNGVVALFSLIAIFMYKNRSLQIRVTNLALLIDCGLLGLLFFSADSMSNTLQTKVHYLYGTYVPVIIAVLLFIAIRCIKRDEALVRSADRLR